MRTLTFLVLAALPLLLLGCGDDVAPGPTKGAGAGEGDPGPEKVTALSLLEDADKLFRRRRYLASRPVYEKTHELALIENDVRAQVESLAQVARTYSIERKFDDARTWLARAERLASKEEPWGYTRFLGVRGILEREAGDKPKAVATFEAMYAYAMEKGLHKRAIDAAHHVAIAAAPETQVAWGKKGIAAAEKLGERSWLAVLWNNLGASYEDLKRYDEALAAYRKARDFHHQGENETPKMIADWAVGHALRLTGDTKEARAWLTRTLTWAEKLQATEGDKGATWVGYCLEELGHLDKAAGALPEAAAKWRKARAAFVKGGMASHWPEHLEELDGWIAAAEAGN